MYRVYDFSTPLRLRLTTPCISPFPLHDDASPDLLVWLYKKQTCSQSGFGSVLFTSPSHRTGHFIYTSPLHFLSSSPRHSLQFQNCQRRPPTLHLPVDVTFRRIWNPGTTWLDERSGWTSVLLWSAPVWN